MKRQDARLLPLLAAAVTTALALASAPTSAQTQSSPSSAPLVVHEWGTFTSLQDESGRAVGGINTDDEPVPTFVHRVSDFLLLTPTQVPANYFQGAPSCHPDVTMRLETPVLYFHTSASQPSLQGVNVSAQFRGGWLTEFYPSAVAQAPGVGGPNDETFGALRGDTVGTLTWSNLNVGADAPGPTTSEHVWTAPRAVQAASVRASSGEAEKFLFYRGVGHIDAPITVAREGASQLVLRSQLPKGLPAGESPQVKALWLVDIAADGSVAFRTLPPVSLEGTGKVLAHSPAEFAAADYSDGNREELKNALHAALMDEGLFSDEAQALLDTWELSYFKSSGLRVFFMVPRAWTDFYLPLNVSALADITRVMVGRVELVTPEQRHILRQIAQTPGKVASADAEALYASFFAQVKTERTPEELKHRTNLLSGRESFAASGVTVPKSYQLYLSLGRFRNALILDEASRHPDDNLNEFIRAFRLAGYSPPVATAAN